MHLFDQKNRLMLISFVLHYFVSYDVQKGSLLSKLHTYLPTCYQVQIDMGYVAGLAENGLSNISAH